MKKLLKLLFSRAAFVALFMLLQLFVLFSTLFYFQDSFTTVQTISVALALVTVVYIINQDGSSAFKIAWILPIVFLPLFGIPMYILFGKKRTPESQRTKLSGMLLRYRATARAVSSRTDDVAQVSAEAALQSAYLERCAGAPVFRRTETKYYKLGDELFPAMLEELKKAERFIFMEYFIVEPGVMWDAILEVLTQKAAEGLDVRLIYDDMGCIMILPTGYDRTLEQMGIKCRIFNPFVPILSSRFNTRDHRKICVIDGNVGFTGGINLADEYINAYEKHGHWKDTSILLKGEAVFNLTVMFLSMWDYLDGTTGKTDYSRYYPTVWDENAKGYVQPFADNPLDDEAVGETVYLNLINKAKRYVYITTPYLILSSEMLTALTSAAKCGVDVRIITPHIPDKWYVHAVSRSHYQPLIEAGVKIYEYTPGFIHAKTFVVDDDYAVVGTINLDYRSLYLHFECAVWMYQTPSVAQVRDDFFKTQQISQEITLEECRSLSFPRRLGRSVLRVFAPLM